MLRDASAGSLEINTALSQQNIAIDSIGRDELIFANGGIERRIRVFRLPDDNPHRALRIEREIPLLDDRDNALYVRVTFEDGHYAWSSPIYLFR
jgi:hypothetical protein